MRVKHLMMLLSSLIFIIICFVVMNISNEMINYEKYEIDITSTLSSDTFIVSTKNGAKCQSYLEEGEMVLIVEQPNTSYDEIYLTILCNTISYDTTHLEEIIGNNLEQNQDYLNAFKNGPWVGKIYFSISKYNDGKIKNDTYTVTDKNKNITTHKIATSGNSKLQHTDTLIFDANKDEYFEIMLGSKFGGAIDSGTYYLKATLVIEGLYESDEQAEMKLTIIDKIVMFFKASFNAFKNAGIKGLFSVSNFVKLYFTIVLVGMGYYLWKDARSAYFIGRNVENYSIRDALLSLKECAFAGQYAHSDEIPGITNILALLIGTVVAYAILALTLPIRVLIVVVRDIIGILFPMDSFEKIPGFANFIGSLGCYLVLLGFTLMFKLSFWIGLVTLLVGALLVIPAHKKTIDKYPYWDY